MNRRYFLQASAAVVVGSTVTGVVSEIEAAEPQQVRRVVFNPPDEKICAIYWMHGHVEIEKFYSWYSQIEAITTLIRQSDIKHGWGTRKLESIVMYLSDRPLENFEPITYWIPADVLKADA